PFTAAPISPPNRGMAALRSSSCCRPSTSNGRPDFDLIISHNPGGEYSRHIRHEEVSKAVIKLWHAGKISANELWIFAYEDGDKKYYPKPILSANVCNLLTERIWQKKYSIITETYGFEISSFEAETTPRAESFWQFTNSIDAQKWLNQFEN
ncbi:MAG: hypothetical protein R6W81_01345, partial [Bacteroidales bacterium]